MSFMMTFPSKPPVDGFRLEERELEPPGDGETWEDKRQQLVEETGKHWEFMTASVTGRFDDDDDDRVRHIFVDLEQRNHFGHMYFQAVSIVCVGDTQEQALRRLVELKRPAKVVCLSTPWNQKFFEVRGIGTESFALSSQPIVMDGEP